MADNRIIALNVGSQRLTGAIFSVVGNGGLRLDRIEQHALTGDPADEEGRKQQITAGLKEISGKLKLGGAKTVYVVSSFPVLLKFASLPALDGERVDQIVEFEAQQQVPYPINEVVWGYQLMGDVDDIEVEVLLAAVKADELNEIDAAVNASGLKSKGAEVAPVALFNALKYNYGDVEGTTLLIDIGARTTDMIFMEGGRVFIRTVKIGGAELTKALAKEFATDFAEADEKKASVGFVALGGAYADHEDPEVAAISKVVRNSLTRLHSEVMRTINFYRSQQGGSAPQLVLLSGGTAGLTYIREFFAEKLNLPVDHFNALRNVTVGSGVDTDYAARNAHSLGELVGSALKQIGPVPVDIELVPASVAKARDLEKRKLALVLAPVALACFLGALGFFLTKGTEVADRHAGQHDGTAKTLQEHNRKIEDLKAEIAKVDERKKPYIEAVRHRVYWVRVFNYLNNKFQNDIIFMTGLEPLSGGRPVIADDATALVSLPAGQDAIIDAFAVRGLWRENTQGGSQVVYDYFRGLKADAESEDGASFFALKDVDISEVTDVHAGTGGDRYAYPFSMTLPLPEENKVKFSK